MSDDAQAPQVPQDAAATPWASPDRSAPPPTQIDMPSAAGPEDAIPGGNPQPVSPPGGSPDDGAAGPRPEPNPWAPPVDQAPSHAPGAPTPPSVHNQPTVVALPGTGTPGHPQSPPQSWDNPFASPAAAPAPHPRPAAGEPVPPPPIAPEGPGQVPYGYGYGYPAYPTPGPGYPGAAGYGWPMMPPAPSNGMGTAGLVLGIISAVVFCLWPVAIILGILAVIFGVLGRRRARRGEANNPGQALAGIICGAVGIALGIAMIVVFFVLPDNSGNSDPFSGDDGYSTSLVVPHLG
ncbi:DUF4190 domain-containing protein [Streptomyces mirabilis]|uniref:DUF4190 domain-containing protein n=1 Tax=Streptomyces mirabilis TaxID=68239 RepID=UPI00224FB38F|nr:DUF4190 domain-containing protein [Streptomyces mirabilis]MCX4421054.1 DUF4190 domain-containing protein [Streptomyces mirabilis]